MKKILLLLGLSFITITTVTAQNANRSKFVADSLPAYITRALTNWRIPGAAVCIVKDNKIVLMKGYGIKELGLNNKVDENTLFMIGSNTKAFTATALAMLAEDKKLSLDDKVTKYIPDFKLENKAATELATVRDLLCHRLGFQTFQGDFTFYNTNLSRENVIKRLGIMKAQYGFRTRWGYTNSAFLTAGEIIPKVTKQNWDIYLKEKIFAPLGMGNTLGLSVAMPKAINRTVPHTISDGRLIAIPYANLDNLAPAGSISSSVNDMSKWVMALLNEGKVGTRQVIPLNAIKATRQPQDIVGTSRHLDGTVNYQLYGLGWFLQDYHNHRLVMHDGGVNGYVSSVTLVPEEKLGIIILTNTDQNSLYEALRWEILDAYFKLPYRNYSDAYLKEYKTDLATQQAEDKKRRDTVATNPRTALSMSYYEGKFSNPLYGNLTVERGDNNELNMRFEHHPKMYAKLQPLGGNRFYATFSDPVLGKAVFTFTVQNGKVTGVTIKVADFIEYGAYEFTR
ncbi:serine hydrolase [Mucilaginibacter limnophilus]|uniref:Serine hydrolase n=1 Tax=Mucilaginibacter limnophilus TaxID=1932778 RepID=A0A3S2XYL5_9SPHI|nr:serine hydrolase [Mucilaginibacter limnophilus]RVT98133.1 serine hydrolase [Mucilaginibacter limnophilus]